MKFAHFALCITTLVSGCERPRASKANELAAANPPAASTDTPPKAPAAQAPPKALLDLDIATSGCQDAVRANALARELRAEWQLTGQPTAEFEGGAYRDLATWWQAALSMELRTTVRVMLECLDPDGINDDVGPEHRWQISLEQARDVAFRKRPTTYVTRPLPAAALDLAAQLHTIVDDAETLDATHCARLQRVATSKNTEAVGTAISSEVKEGTAAWSAAVATYFGEMAVLVELCNKLKDAPKPVAPLRAALAAFDAHAQAGPAK